MAERLATSESPGRGELRALLVVALLTGLALRLIGLSYPPFDDHSFRQCQTLWTIEDFHARGIDLLHPRTNYVGYPQTFVLELPLFQALMALWYGWFGAHVEIVRLWNIGMGLGTVWLLYRITSYLFGRMAATWTAVIYWLAPLNIIYQRSTLLDPTAVLLALISFDQLARLLGVGRGAELESGLNRSTGRRALGWAVLAVTTWTVALIKTLYLWPMVCLLAWRWWG
ncbi:MAG: glycosyltransferase family 39 protein, partial [Verrucomicrobiae bacterium]|nr:glycosyltransferase family 39 protein [Verrucomicrobiae bacterium]